MAGGLAAVIALNSPLPGAEPKAKDDAANDAPAAAGDDAGTKKKDKPVGAKDPVAAAFALPKGVTLSPTQQAAYDDLKQKYEEQLRVAFDDVQHAEGAAATSRALKEVRESRTKIRDGIQEILAMPYREAADKTNQQPNSSAPAESSSNGYYYPGGYYPGGYYPGGYYPGDYYPPGYYPHRFWGRHASGTKTSGSTKTPASRPQTPPKPAPPPPPKH